MAEAKPQYVNLGCFFGLFQVTANASQIGITSEYIVTTEALKRGYNVLQPVGGFLSYDLVLDIKSVLIKVQVKTAHFSKTRRAFLAATGRHVNNKYRSGFEKYANGDFDFAAVVHKDLPIYIVPFSDFVQTSSFAISLSRDGKNEVFAEAWHLIEEFASNAQRFEQSAFNPHLSEFDSL